MCVFQVDETDDGADYQEMIGAMTTMNMTELEQSEVIQLVSAILHLGNVMFREDVGDKAIVDNDQCKYSLGGEF